MDEPTTPTPDAAAPSRATPASTTGVLSRHDARRATRWSEWVVAFVTTTSMFALLRQLVFHGWSHSFDSAIYVRSLWGVAHGAWDNPLVDLHVMAVHFNLVLLPLAPLARVVHPAWVLIAAQSVAFGATVWLVSRALRQVATRFDADRTAQVGAAWLGIALVLATPVVTNPFLFDIRPDLVGIPLALAGMLRARERGDWDVPAVALLLSSMLAREEYVMVVVGALATTPFGRTLFDRWRLRVAGMAIGTVWFGLYFRGIRCWLDAAACEKAGEVGAAFLSGDAVTAMGDIAVYKAEIALVFLASMALLSLRGWRWLGAALPGLAFVLINSRLQSLMLNFHYLQFAAPGVLVAAVHGAERLAQHPRRAWVLLGLAAGLASFAVSSALPGGGRFRSENFALLLTDDTPLTPADAAKLEQLHELVALIPPDVPAAVPWAVSAAVADRDHIDVSEVIVPELAEWGAPRDGMDWMVLAWRDVGGAARLLIEQHGFVAAAVVEGRAALVTREPGVLVASELLDAAAVDIPCDAPPVRWPALGLAACDAWVGADGVPVLALTRVAPGPPAGVVPAAQPLAGDQGGAPFALAAAAGLVNPRDIPPGAVLGFRAPGPVQADALAVELWVGDQRAPAEVGPGQTTPTVRVPLRERP